jgi:hypothetical protein
MIVSGTEVPKFTKTMHTRKMHIKVMCGKYEMFSARVENNLGVCEWYENVESEAMELPEDLSQIPDIVVSICKGKGTDTIPVSYKRFSFAEVLKDEFSGALEWTLLEEDKALDQLDDDQFPGSVLLKLGVGSIAAAQSSAKAWENQILSSRTKAAYQLRCHIYQASDLPPADDNGLLDPYIKVKFNGLKYSFDKSSTTLKNNCSRTEKTYEVKSMLRKKTRDPLWYQTITFDTELPHPAFFPQVNVQVFDKDASPFDADDYMGCILAPLSQEDIYNDASNMPRKPKWYNLMKETVGDVEGQILCSFQLIKKTTPEMIMTAIPNIVPETRVAFIEILAIGCRNLSPYKFLPLQFPSVEFQMDIGSNGKVTASTNNSKRPDGSNPNFLERVVLKVDLPLEAIYAPPLNLFLKDSRLAGMSTPTCGVSKIQMSTKLPWCVDEFEGLRYSKESNSKVENAGVKALTAFDKDEESLEEEERRLRMKNSVVSDLPSTLQSRIVRKLDEDDTGAGVFGALKHVNRESGQVLKDAKDATNELEEQKQAQKEKKRMSKKKSSKPPRSSMISTTNDDKEVWEDEVDEPPKYMLNRKKLPSELEEELTTCPFQTFTFHLGQGKDRKEVGILKGLIRVMDREDDGLDANGDHPHPSGFDLKTLLKPKQYTIRLYVLRGLNFTPMDVGYGGRQGKSDPYLKVKLGKEVFDDRKNYHNDTVNADFYQCIELHSTLPGAGLLEVNVMDYDMFTTDDLIGKTVIDLEDRLFDQEWKKLGMENRIAGTGAAVLAKKKESDDDGGEDESITVSRWQTKPLENRSIYIPTCHNPQGSVECWVDIMPVEEAAAFAVEKVALPPVQLFEVRVVVWRAKEMLSMDVMEDMNDLYCTAWIEGCEKQSTDIHWRAQKGKGNFNWRMKFDVELGHSTKAMKFPYFHLQAWDKDIVKWNDCIGDALLPLGKEFKRAYKKNERVDMFVQRDRVQEARTRSMKDHLDRIKELEDDDEDEEEDEDEEAPLLSGEDRGGGGSSRQVSEIELSLVSGAASDGEKEIKRSNLRTSPGGGSTASDSDGDNMSYNLIRKTTQRVSRAMNASENNFKHHHNMLLPFIYYIASQPNSANNSHSVEE